MLNVDTLHESGTDEFRVRLVAHPSSVPTARRFVGEALAAWGRHDLAEDVGLCVSELSTNATLHSDSGYFEVVLHRADDGVRVAVLDGGATPAALIAARVEVPPESDADRDFLDALELDLDAGGMTGRGLGIVSALAREWGIEDTATGTRVWAEFVAGHDDPAPRPPVAPALPAYPEPPVPSSGEWYVVRLDGVPPALLHAHDENLADIVRELQLMGAAPDGRSDAQTTVLEEVAGVVRRNATTWDAARIEVREALLAGADRVDITVLAPRNVVEEVGRLRVAVTAAEAMAAAGQLITLPAPEPVQRLRDWMEEQFRTQTEGGREAVTFPDWLDAWDSGAL
jgi:anti-sigma regulatory factor (Ser/Thr protein kinase)